MYTVGQAVWFFRTVSRSGCAFVLFSLTLACPVYSLAHWQVGIHDLVNAPNASVRPGKSTSEAIIQVNAPIVRWPLVGNLKRIGIKQQGFVDANNQRFSWSEWPTSTLADQYAARQVMGMIEGGVADRISSERGLYITGAMREPILQKENRFVPNSTVFPPERFGQSAISNDKWVEQLELMALPSSSREGHAHLGVNLFSSPQLVFDDEQNGFIFHATSEGWLHVFDWESGNELFAIIRPTLLPHWYRSRWYTDNRLSSFADLYMPSQTLFRMAMATSSSENAPLGDMQLLLTNSYSGFGFVQYQVERPQEISMRYEFPNAETSKQLLSSMFTGASLMPPLIIKHPHQHGEDHRALDVTAVITGTGMAFSGGANSASTDEQSKLGGVVAIDAATGSLLWQWQPSAGSAGSPKLRFVAQPAAIDNDQDGKVDAVMLVDLYGRVFYLELPKTELPKTISARRVADLSEHRARFFHPPIIHAPQASTGESATILLTASDLTVSHDQQPQNYVYLLPWDQDSGIASSQSTPMLMSKREQLSPYTLADFLSYQEYVEQLDELSGTELHHLYYRPWYYALPPSSLVPSPGVYDGEHVVLPISVATSNEVGEQHEHWALDLPVTPEAIRESQALTSTTGSASAPLFRLTDNQTAIGLQWQRADPSSLKLCSVQGCTTGSDVDQCDTRWDCILKRVLLKEQRLERLSHWREVQ